MTDSNSDAEYQAYLAFKAQQKTDTAAQDAADEAAKPSITEVLHALIEIAPLATEALKRTYHTVVDEWDALASSVKTAAKSDAN